MIRAQFRGSFEPSTSFPYAWLLIDRSVSYARIRMLTEVMHAGKVGLINADSELHCGEGALWRR